MVQLLMHYQSPKVTKRRNKGKPTAFLSTVQHLKGERNDYARKLSPGAHELAKYRKENEHSCERENVELEREE